MDLGHAVDLGTHGQKVNVTDRGHLIARPGYIDCALCRRYTLKKLSGRDSLLPKDQKHGRGLYMPSRAPRESRTSAVSD